MHLKLLAISQHAERGKGEGGEGRGGERERLEREGKEQASCMHLHESS